MLDLDKAIKFLEHFSLVTVSNDKVPNFLWKKNQSEKLSKNEFTNRYNYKGGNTYVDKDGVIHEIKATENFGIITGFNDLEVIDIDLKVFSTAKEQIDFWNEYIGYLENNILDFYEKFVVYKTKNAGYHILYKSKRKEGNLKLAKLKGHKEAVIETRGIGGYVFAYPDKKVSELSYFDVQYISDDDRSIIMSFSKMYNFINEQPELPKKEKKEYTEGEITPWDDYNNKHSIFDIIGEDFNIVGNLSSKYVIKRHGASSPHSGYVFKDSGFMYLFSTGTIYPHEKLVTPFSAYSIKYHNSDIKAAVLSLYEKGYGSRRKVKLNELKDTFKEKLVINTNDLIFPIDIFPIDIQNYILECNKKLDSSIDYMGCSMLWLLSVCIGNSLQIEVKKGWIETASIWISIVGKAGLGKTPSINNIIFPLMKINSKQIKDFIKATEKYEHYQSLTKNEKDQYSEVKKPIKTQFIANDITLEALVDLHQESDNAVGVFKDELAGWLKDMNKYREGSDLEFWLSTWSGKSVNLNRLSRKGSFIESPFIPVLGGIQPSILNIFYTDENKDNGFMDRMLLCYPELQIDHYNDNEISEDLLKWYKESIIMFYETIKSIIVRDDDGDIVPTIANFSDDAKTEWKRIFNSMTDVQNNDDENEYLKSMYPKQKSYIPRFSLIIQVINSFFDSTHQLGIISKDSILKAEKLSKYFIETAKKIKFNSSEINKMKQTISTAKNKSTKEKLHALYLSNEVSNKSEVAELLGVSRVTINKWLNELENE